MFSGSCLSVYFIKTEFIVIIFSRSSQFVIHFSHVEGLFLAFKDCRRIDILLVQRYVLHLNVV